VRPRCRPYEFEQCRCGGLSDSATGSSAPREKLLGIRPLAFNRAQITVRFGLSDSVCGAECERAHKGGPTPHLSSLLAGALLDCSRYRQHLFLLYRHRVEQSIPNNRCLFHGGRKSDKSTVTDRQAILEEPSLNCQFRYQKHAASAHCAEPAAAGACGFTARRLISVRRTRQPLSARERPCWRARRSTPRQRRSRCRGASSATSRFRLRARR
jgi:hypothetical protein